MKKCVVVLAVLLAMCRASWGDVAIDEEHFPDELFRMFVTVLYDENFDGILNDEEASQVTTMDAGGYGFESLKGIENFPELIGLVCWANNISELDVSHNAKLRLLHCESNDMVSLNLGDISGLQGLYCQLNKLESLDLSRSSSLVELECNDNLLTSLNLSANPYLNNLQCDNNRLRVLDVSNHRFLEELSCWSNDLASLNASGCVSLDVIYCYANQLINLDVSGCENLEVLSCGLNQLGSLNLRSNPHLKALECSVNYLASLDLSANTELEELYCSSTAIRELDLSSNASLTSLACSSNDIMTLDLSGNPRLESLACHDNGLNTLYITSSSSSACPYQTDLTIYTGNNYSRVRSLSAYDKDGEEIRTLFTPGDSTALFAEYPSKIAYDFAIGYTGTSQQVPSTVRFTIGIPTHSLILPDVDVNRAESNDEPVKASSGSSGGCNSGLGLAAMMAGAAGLACKRKRICLALVIMAFMASCLYAGEVIPSDYALPIPYEIYTPKGSYMLDFEFTPELAEKIASHWENGLSADKVHSYSEIALPGSWDIRPVDLYNLSMNGEYAAVMLPLTESGTGDEVYVLRCRFGDDVNPGEYIGLSGFSADTSARETVYEENNMTMLEKLVVLDDELNPVMNVPANRQIYAAVSLRPEYVNTGIITVVRGQVVPEEDPAGRVDPEIAQLIADDLGIPVEKLRYISRTHIGNPEDPTEDMKDYVKNDGYEIMTGLYTVSMDEEGGYYTRYTLPDDIWEQVKDKEVSSFRFYELNDDGASEDTLKSSSIIFGLINAYEVSGGRLEIFDTKTIILAGLLQASTPFSVFIGKLLLALLAGGCSTGINPAFSSLAIGITILTRLFKKH